MKVLLNSKIDGLEAEFEKNRQEMTALRASKQNGTRHYEELLEANHRINDEIHATLEQLWKLDE